MLGHAGGDRAGHGRGRRSAAGSRARRSPRRACSTGPEKTTRPVTRIVTSAHREARSSIRWLERTTATPSSAARSMTRWTWRLPAGSRPLAGSSRTSSRGRVSSAAARPSRCRIPSEKPRTRTSATSISPACSSSVVDVGGTSGPDAAERGQRGEVLPSGQRRVEAGAVDEAGDAVGDRERPTHRPARGSRACPRPRSPRRAAGRGASSCRRRWDRPARGPALVGRRGRHRRGRRRRRSTC